MKIIAVDLDDTLCSRPVISDQVGPIEKYKYCYPLEDNIKRINEYTTGSYVIIYTARGMTSLQGNIKNIEHYLRPITEKQLKKWGVRYDKLVFGKAHYDVIIDDKSLYIKDI